MYVTFLDASNAFDRIDHWLIVNIDPSGQYWHNAANRHLTVLAQYWQTVPAL